MRILQKIAEWIREFRKDLDALSDVFRPRGWLEIRLIHAHGPQKGQVAMSRKYRTRVPVMGRNVVIGFVPPEAGPVYSGRDIMRRLIVPSGFSGALTSDDYKIGNMELGSGTTAETSGDTDLDTPIANSMKAISDVEYDGSNPYVTFVAQWEENEVNQSISEAMLWSDDETHPWARKTFTAFTKNNNFVLQLRWMIRF